MKPKSIHFDSVFEKRWYKYLTGLTEKQKEQLRERLAIFKEDVFDKRLKTHRLKGNLKEYYSWQPRRLLLKGSFPLTPQFS